MITKVYNDASEMGKAAGRFVADKLISTINQKGSAKLILATGASQFTFLEELKKIDGINWSQITVFHLDEYIGLTDKHPASFRKYLRERILDDVKPGMIHFINGDFNPIEDEIKRYSSLLKDADIDHACIGIGENGHIAFNDPPVADFNDSLMIKKVELDKACRMQQVGEGWFKDLEEVPTHALTLSIPAIMRAKTISCVVPDKRKARAVKNTLEGPISTKCPASILRNHKDCHLFLDKFSASRTRNPSERSGDPDLSGQPATRNQQPATSNYVPRPQHHRLPCHTPLFRRDNGHWSVDPQNG